MTKKSIFILALTLLLGGFSLYLNRDWFASEELSVSHRSLPPRDRLLRGAAAKGPANPVLFMTNRKLQLTSVKVVPVSEISTNPYAHPLWELTSESNSIPVKQFLYGAGLRGMKPAVKGAGADPLVPGVNYRLLIEAGSARVQHDFIPVRRTQ
jgi:hypothetical protein